MKANYLSNSIEDARLKAAEEDFARRSDLHYFDFNPDDWVVCRLSFGIRIIQVEFSGHFNSVYLRLATDADFETIEKAF